MITSRRELSSQGGRRTTHDTRYSVGGSREKAEDCEGTSFSLSLNPCFPPVELYWHEYQVFLVAPEDPRTCVTAAHCDGFTYPFSLHWCYAEFCGSIKGLGV